MSAISSLSTTTLTDTHEKENTNIDDTIHDEIDDIYKMVLIFYLYLRHFYFGSLVLQFNIKSFFHLSDNLVYY